MSKLYEFKRGWSQIVAATVGLGIGILGLGSYNLGLFAKDLNSSIGLTKTAYGAGYTAFCFGLAAGLPFWGRLAARFGVSKVTAASAFLLCLSFVALAEFTVSPAMYVLLTGCVGLAGGATSALTFTRTISVWFDRARGFALGLTQVGLGLSGALIPPIVGGVIHKYGWHDGYLALAAISAIGIPVAVVFLRLPAENSLSKGTSAGKVAADIATEEEFKAARSGRVFWTLLAAFMINTLYVAGSAQHLVPMLLEFGLSGAQAAKFLGLLGLGTVAARLCLGWLSDMVHAQFLMAGACLLGAAGVAGLLAGGPEYAGFYAVTLGCAFGGEIDLLGYMCSRYFGPRLFPRAYSWQYSSLLIGCGVGPFLLGSIADHFKSYTPCLWACGFMAVISAFIFICLPRYSKEIREEVFRTDTMPYPSSSK